MECELKSRLLQNVVAVYSDTDVKIKVDSGDQHIICLYPGKRFLKHAKKRIILFSSDMQSLAFYESNRTQMQKGAVYIGLRETEPGLVCSDIDKNAKLVDLSGAIARTFWRDELKLWDTIKSTAWKTPVNIVIYGDSMLAEDLLSCGLLLNLYSRDQQVIYHMVSSNRNFMRKHPGFNTMNKDEIHFHDREEEIAWEEIRKADFVLVADALDTGDFQVLAANTDADKLYVYSRDGRGPAEYIGLGGKEKRKVCRFGMDDGVLTYPNICEDELIKDAKALNDKYGEKNPGYKKNWEELDRFTQNSNISAADYRAVIGEIREHKSETELAELEHIRWC